MRPISEVLASV